MSAYLFTFGGPLAGAQRWSIGFAANYTGPTGQPSGQDLSDTCNRLFDDFNTSAWNPAAAGAQSLAAVAGSAAGFDTVRGYYRGPGTRALVSGVSTRGNSPGSGSPNLPPQNAIVVTLNTGLAGKSYRGRVYLPNRTQIVSADGNLPSALCNGIALSVANFLSVMRTRSVGTQQLVPVVNGRGVPNPPITAVAVDSVGDTQRRRRDKIVATTRAVRTIIVG